MRHLLAALLVTGTAFADGIQVPGDYPRVDVEVGKTVEHAVGYYRGRWFCDDPSLLSAELITRANTNYFVVTGVKVGSTQCRVGTELEGFTVMNVYVAAAKPKAKK